MAQCAAKTKDGTPCQTPAQNGQRYCHAHRKQRTQRWILSTFGIGTTTIGVLGFVANVTSVLGYFGINPSPLLRPQPTNQDRPFDLLIIDLPKGNISNTTALGDYDTVVHTFAIGQVDSDVTPNVRFLSARFPFGYFLNRVPKFLYLHDGRLLHQVQSSVQELLGYPILCLDFHQRTE